MSTEKANDRQVAGTHYKTGGLEHWDVCAQLSLDYFQGQISKYVFRWRNKGGVTDLKKAAHFLQKYIELQEPKLGSAVEGAPKEPEPTKLKGREVRPENAVPPTPLDTGILPSWWAVHCQDLRAARELAEGGGPTKLESAAEEVPNTLYPSGLCRSDENFTYEGGFSGGDMYRCKSCKVMVHVPIYRSPYEYHFHELAEDGEPTSAYVDQ